MMIYIYILSYIYIHICIYIFIYIYIYIYVQCLHGNDLAAFSAVPRNLCSSFSGRVSSMGPPPALIESFQAAGVRALELLALRQSLLSAVPPCPAVSLACPPANVSCPPPPACPVPLINISCPPAAGVGGPDGLDVPSACWGGLVGASAGAEAAPVAVLPPWLAAPTPSSPVPVVLEEWLPCPPAW